MRQLLADKVSGNLIGLWLLIPEHLRLGTWDLLCGWSGQPGQRVEPRLALQLIHEAALCSTGVRQQRSLSQRGFELANGLPFVASDVATSAAEGPINRPLKIADTGSAAPSTATSAAGSPAWWHHAGSANPAAHSSATPATGSTAGSAARPSATVWAHADACHAGSAGSPGCFAISAQPSAMPSDRWAALWAVPSAWRLGDCWAPSWAAAK